MGDDELGVSMKPPRFTLLILWSLFGTTSFRLLNAPT